MLPLPDLDNRFWEQIVAEARKSISGLVPEWTDENYHDPGITLIELLGWLMEIQQYYLNRITEVNERKFLKLLGVELQEIAPARVDVTFRGVKEEYNLLSGTKLAAGGQIFETKDRFLLVPAAIDRLIALTEEGPADYTAANENDGVHYLAFGREAKKGSRLYIGFDRPLLPGYEITLTINLFEDYPVSVNELSGAESILPSAKIAWYFYGGAATPGWLPLDVLIDRTLHLTCSGRITFRLTEELAATFIHPAHDRGRYWLCCILEEGGYEVVPRIMRVSTNTVPALHRETWCALLSLDGNGLPGQSFTIQHALAWHGELTVQVQEQDGSWRYWQLVDALSPGKSEEYCYMLQREENSRKIIVSFSSDNGVKIPPVGESNIRVITYAPSFRLRKLIGASNGLPGQVFRLAGFAPMLDQVLMLQVGKKVPGKTQLLWDDWELVDDFTNSTAEDRHFTYDGEREEVAFGDNERGLIPDPAGLENICIISCQTGGGARGNVRPGTIDTIIGMEEELSGINVTNHFYATGGREKETLNQGKERVLRELQEQERAVTGGDYEKLTLATPGLRVARVKALPLYAPGMRDYPRNQAPGQVTVVVVPYSEAEYPLPGKGFLETVKKHLDGYRLITTEVHVVPPEYIKISVNAVVVVEPHFQDVSSVIIEAMHNLLIPLDGKGPDGGWEFGRTVYRGDIYSAISSIPGVIYIEDLWLQAEGRGFSRDSSGNINIPPNGLVYSDNHDIKTLSEER